MALTTFNMVVALNEKNEFVGAHFIKTRKAKVHKRVDYKDRGTLFKEYSRNGKLVGMVFMRPNDCWRFLKAMVTTAKPKKAKKNVARNQKSVLPIRRKSSSNKHQPEH